MPINPELLAAAVAVTHDRYLDELASLVNLDCGSYTPAGVNRVADHVAAASPASARPSNAFGTSRPTARRSSATWSSAGSRAWARLLLIGHMDTVFEPGTAPRVPIARRADERHGPGVTDMKAGLLAGLHAWKRSTPTGARPSVTFVANPDEEIGSPFSTDHIRGLVAEHDVALVLECARANGDIVSARKGIADAEVALDRPRRACRHRAGKGSPRDPRRRSARWNASRR